MFKNKQLVIEVVDGHQSLVSPDEQGVPKVDFGIVSIGFAWTDWSRLLLVLPQSLGSGTVVLSVEKRSNVVSLGVFGSRSAVSDFTSRFQTSLPATAEPSRTPDGTSSAQGPTVVSVLVRSRVTAEQFGCTARIEWNQTALFIAKQRRC